MNCSFLLRFVDGTNDHQRVLRRCFSLFLHFKKVLFYYFMALPPPEFQHSPVNLNLRT